MIVRRSFPQVYKGKYRNGSVYWIVSARSKKWGMDERKTFNDETEALNYAREVEARIVATGAQPTVPQSIKISASSYDKLVERLRPYDKTPEEAVDHYLRFLGEQAIRSVKPSIGELADKWKAYREADKTLSQSTLHELKLYSRFIRTTWGDKKPDDVTKQDIDLKLKGMAGNNTTRKKYLTYIRNFFNWVKDEKLLIFNPTDGIKFKLADFEADFYSPEETKKLLQYVLKNEPDLIGYYALLTFAGLRPTEGKRVEWQDINFKTGELYVRKGKTPARHIPLEPVALEWLKYHREKTKQGEPFIRLPSLGNREKRVRQSMERWIADGLRHGFGTYFKNLKKNLELTADVMGNSPAIIKRHYARTIEQEKIEEFWGLTPKAVGAGEGNQPSEE